MTTQQNANGSRLLRAGLIVVIIALAFVASYRIALAASAGDTRDTRGTSATDTAARTTAAGIAGATREAQTTPPGTGTCACCGGSGNGERIEASAVLGADGVQRITVDTSNGYDPSVITLEAGVPAEITFKRALGCLGQVKSDELGFFEDLTTGDKTVSLDALTPGTYGFSCGMEMVFGEIIVK